MQDFVAATFNCSAETAAMIARKATVRRFPARATLLQQDQPPTQTYLLLAGRARAALTTTNGTVLQTNLYAPGDLFGAVAASNPWAEVVAVEPVAAARFGGRDFAALVDTHACVGGLLSRLLLRRLAQLTEQFRDRAILSAGGRVCAELLRLANGDDVIRPAPVLSELALSVQTTRETVSRTIGNLERRRLIERSGDRLLLLSRERLAALVV